MATKKKREVEVEAYLKKICKQHDGEYRKWVSPGRRGVPDDIIILPCFDPSVQFVEAKAPGEVPEDHQEREHTRLRDAGGIVHVLDSEDAIDDLFYLMCGRAEHSK
jgi:hypothetical protein